MRKITARSILVVGIMVLLAMVFGSMTVWGSPGRHVENTVPFPQPGVASVTQNGNNGLVEVELDCIVPGKKLTFAMEIGFPDGESADLGVRRQGRPPDLSGWVSMTPNPLDEPAIVMVEVDVPEEATPGTSATVRIQDGPGGTGNHHGVKVHICVAEAPPTLPPPVTQPPVPTPSATPTLLATPTPTFVAAIGTSLVIGPTPTPEVIVPIKLPQTGAEMSESSYWLDFGVIIPVLLAAFGLPMVGLGFLFRRYQ